MTHPHSSIHIAWYGNIALCRGYCSECGSYTLITGDSFTCCGKTHAIDIRGQRRMVQTPLRKCPPSKDERDRILREQHQKCFYCSRLFGATVYRKARAITLRAEWDHIIPWVYGMNNSAQNFVAACQVCNHLKGAVMFNSLGEAQVFVHEKWKVKGYTSEAPVFLLQRDVHPET